MTVAICYRCGAQKSGAFVSCRTCGFVPDTETELAYALAFTDHHLPKDVLTQVGDGIRNGAEPPKLDEASLNAMLGAVRSSDFAQMIGRRTKVADRNPSVVKNPSKTFFQKFFKW